MEPSFHRQAAACRPITAPAELPRYDSSVVAAVLLCSIPDGAGGSARIVSLVRVAMFYFPRRQQREILKKID